MGEVLFTTIDVANILGVNTSTIKRWTDEGILKCFRTPGGHRKFFAEDVDRFIKEHNLNREAALSLAHAMTDEMIIRSIVQKKEYTVLQSVCLSSALKGKTDESMELLMQLVAAGMTSTEIVDFIIDPVTDKLEMLVSKHKLSVQECHSAIQSIQTVMAKIKEKKIWQTQLA